MDLIGRDDPERALIRHDLAYVLAEAAQTLWPGTPTAIGPEIEHGFYYGFDRDPPFTPGRPAHHRGQDTRDRRRARTVCPRRVELRGGPGAFPGRGPRMRHTSDVGNAFKLTHLAGAYWRGDAKNKRLSRIYGVAFSNKSALDSRLIMMAEAEKREPTGYVEVNSPGIRERALWET